MEQNLESVRPQITI